MFKILEELGNNQFKIELQQEDTDKSCVIENGFGVVHDYVYFKGMDYPKNPDGSTNFNAAFKSTIQIHIKTFAKVILPLLIKHKYLQEGHLKDRIHAEDDKYNEPPRFKKGDSYAAYSYCNEAIIFYNDNGQKVVAVSLAGEKDFSCVTYEFYEKFVKNNITYPPIGNKLLK